MVFWAFCGDPAPSYMGVRTGCDNPGEHQHIDMGGAGPQQRAGAGIDGGAGGEHVVDQHQPAAGNLRLFLRRHAEGALHIVGAFRLGQADLLRRRAHAFERTMQHRHARYACNRPGQRRRLVETPRPEPSPMQRHRQQRVGVGEQFAAGARHPAPHHRRQIEPVAVFEGQHQRAGDVVIAHRGARAVIGRRIGDRLHRQQAGAGIVGERDAEPRAIRRLDQRQFRPAGRAQADAVAERLAAGRAQRRQRHVEGKAQRGAQIRREIARGARAPFHLACRDKLVHAAKVPDVIEPDHLRPQAAARAPTARAGAWGRDLPDRPGGRRAGRAAAAVLRQFERAVDLGTPTDAVRRVLAASGKVATIVAAAPAAGAARCVAARRRRRGGAAVRRRLARSGGVRAVAAIRQ